MMNRYGAQALRHWQTFAPSRFARIEDPDQFFQDLGSQVETEIEARTEQLLASRASSGEYLRNLGQHAEARSTAESEVLRELVLIPAEPGSTMDEDRDQTTSDEDPTSGVFSVKSGPWMPVEEDTNSTT